MTRPLVFIGILATFTQFTISAEQERNVPDGFVAMFDGKSLKGWTAMPSSASKAWSAKDGMIVGDGDGGRSYLSYDQGEIADFEMLLSYRFPGKGNSGVNIRSQIDETGKRDFKSYHVDFGHVGIGKQVLGAWDFHTPNRREHGCFRGDRLVIDENDEPTVTKIEGAITLDEIHKTDWNHVRIIAKDNHFKYYLNGKLSSEFTEHLPPERRLKQGMIQLQLHDPGMIVEFKDLYLKVLDD